MAGIDFSNDNRITDPLPNLTDKGVVGGYAGHRRAKTAAAQDADTMYHGVIRSVGAVVDREEAAVGF